MESPRAFGPFEVRGELGRGAGGVAYVAWQPDADRTAAVKLYSAAPKDATGAIARVKRDAQAAGALGHPNIAAVLAVGEHDGCPWVATEFVPGVSLAQVMRGRTLLPIERVLDIWRQMCEGLAHAHREGVLHLDLKPSDVRLAPSGEVKLVDFGSWHVKALDHGVSGRVDGGLHYRAPELLVGRRPDRRADVFSVAAIVYELVAYRKAFPGDSTTDVVRLLARCEPDLACLPRSPFTPGFERVLAASLARAPDARHGAFEEVHADLVQLVRETAPRLRSQPDPGEASPPEREELLASVTRARAEDRLEDALEGCRVLLERDSEDEAARRATSEIEAVLVEREVDTLVGMALSYAADGDIALAAGIAEKVERLAPWSPRYLQLQVYLDEESARRHADSLVASAREHLAAGRHQDARETAQEASVVMPGHAQASRLVQELGLTPIPSPVASPAASVAASPVAPAVASPVAPAVAAPVAAPPMLEPVPAPLAVAAPPPPVSAEATGHVAESRPVLLPPELEAPRPVASESAGPPESPAAAAEPAGAGTADRTAGGPNEQGVSEPAAPEAATPEAATPETATPETATPETATPEAATPDANTATDVGAAIDSAEPVESAASPMPAEVQPAASSSGAAEPDAERDPAVVVAAAPPEPESTAAPVDKVATQAARVAEAVALSTVALQHFLKDDHAKARAVVERALELDPGNRRALELQKVLRVLG